MDTSSRVTEKGGIANPNPLGLCAFGLTTTLLNIQNAGFFEMNAMILAMGLFYGGLAQIIAGIIAAKRSSVFGLTAFTSYGFFWLSLMGLLVFPKLGLGVAPSQPAMCAYFSVWGIFTFLLFFGTLKFNRALQFVFASATILFILLVISEARGDSDIKHIAGYVGMFCGLSATYTGVAGLLNDAYKRIILPVGTIKV